MALIINLSATNFTDETNPSCTYSISGYQTLSSVKINIVLYGEDSSVTLLNYTRGGVSGGTVSPTLTDSQRDEIRSAMPNSTSAKVVYTVTCTYSIDGNSYTTSARSVKTLTIVRSAPTVTVYAIDQNEDTIALTGDNTKFIRYHSTLLCTLNYSIKKGASLASIVTIIGDRRYSTYDDSTGIVFAGVNSPYIEVCITDTRGFSTRYTKTLSMVDYIELTSSINANSMTGDGEFTLDIDGVWFNGSLGTIDNSLGVYYRYKVDAGSYGDWIQVTPTENDNNYEFITTISGLDYRSSYTFQAKAVDALSEVLSVERLVTFTPVFDWGSSDFKFNVPLICDDSLTVNGAADFQDTVTFGSTTEFQGNITATETADFQNGVTFAGDANFQGNITATGTADFQNDATFGGITATGTADFQGDVTAPTVYLNDLRDKSGNVLVSPIASYTSAGIDPDTTLDSLILTHINTPNGAYMYIRTDFYASRSTTSNRMQTAFYYNQVGPPHYRYYYNGTWSDWTPMSGKKYTTGEVATGDIWIDGKPIYRQVVQASVTTTDSTVTIKTIDNFDYLINMTGTVKRTGSGSQFGMNFWSSSSSYHGVWVRDTGVLVVRTTNAVDVYIIIEYTKTTD